MSAGLTKWETREQTIFLSAPCLRSGENGGILVILAQLSRRNVVIGSPRRLTSIKIKCAQFAVAGTFHITTYMTGEKSVLFHSSHSGEGGWSSSGFYPVACDEEGSENPAWWLEDMLGDALLNRVDRCAMKVINEILSLLKYTSASQPIKYRCSVQYVCTTRISLCLSLCVCGELLYHFSLKRRVLCWGMSDRNSDLFTKLETRVSYVFFLKHSPPSRCMRTPYQCEGSSLKCFSSTSKWQLKTAHLKLVNM